jgi:hypothetical protein
MTFVNGTAHAQAMPLLTEISRGGSITAHWEYSELEAVDWPAMAEALKDHDGPVY